VNPYFDTSALVKLYVEEEGSPVVHGALQQATVAATSVLAYVEAISALARRRREGGLVATEYRRALGSLDADWVHYQRVGVTEQLVHKAAETAESFQLCAYDAVHLASALTIAARLETPVVFACWDDGLEDAARRAGLQLLAR
jgi:predicted nucleic acid-binding protein